MDDPQRVRQILESVSEPYRTDIAALRAGNAAARAIRKRLAESRPIDKSATEKLKIDH
jgi:hypothetical protein